MNTPVVNVLLVEDSPTDALLIREALATSSNPHFHMTQSETLTEALRALQQETFHIALVDPGLPDSQGMETCQRICAHTPTLPVIILTINDDQDLALQAVSAGAQDYLVKNRIDDYSLVRAIRYAIERQRTDMALKESEERFRQLAEHIRDVFWIYDPIAERLLYVSPAYEHIWGRPSHTLFQQPEDWIAAIHPEDQQQVREADSRARCDAPFHEDYRIIRPDGKIRWICERGFPIRNAEGTVYRVVGIAEDFTDFKLQEDERLRQSKLESLSLLAGGIAHDFNNLLTAILGNISLSKTSLHPSTRAFQQLTNAEKASLHAKDLSQKLLTFAKGGKPVKTMTRMPDLIHEAVTFALTGSNVHSRFHLPEDLWPCEVDEGQMKQVIHNLVLNGQQAMPGGGTITIRGENLRNPLNPPDGSNLNLYPGDYIKISIKDEGIGMAKNQVTKIFDPYFSTKEQGSGLGLSTAYAIIHNHGGFIKVDSTINLGTTFDIYLPASPDATPHSPHQEELSYSGNGKILIMDDDPSIRDLLTGMLSHLGYTVEVSSDGREAIRLYQEADAKGHPFAAVIMDLTVPGGMGGAEALQQLRESHPAVKAIVSSGYSTDPIMSHYQAYGFSGVLAKPYRLIELSHTLQTLLSSQSP